ncbi:hypothetical protein DY000_02030536 [Brassica cretica]|uniref:Uncharacterized protein n=1 Tax=Brassica cretica TaxID=69181 RepID=A0ABQ7E0J9_BRACR|nr:hypothetical protein DY000_02030536 [Brassica cretica]
MMECDDHADNLLGQDLMDLEAMGQSSGVVESSRAEGSDKDTKRAKSGSKGSAPLGIQTKKTEFLRRRSPRSMAVVPFEHNLSHKPLLITEEKAFRAGIHRSGGEQDDKSQLRWREKRREIVSVESSSMDVAPYEHMPSIKFQSSSVDRPYQSENQKHGGERSGKRLVSAIVTPVRQLASMEDNVTVQSNLNRSLTFSPQGSAIMTENDQIIGALNDLVEPFDGAMMECDDHANDLLGQDLMDLEAMGQSSGVAESSCAKGSDKDTKRAKSGSKGSAPLGIQTKRTEFLRRGSPRLRSTKIL